MTTRARGDGFFLVLPSLAPLAWFTSPVEGGHRAIVFNRLSGVKDGVMAEGMHFVVPWFEWPYIYDVRTKPRNVQVRRPGCVVCLPLIVVALSPRCALDGSVLALVRCSAVVVVVGTSPSKHRQK